MAAMRGERGESLPTGDGIDFGRQDAMRRDKHQRLKRHLQILSQATHPCAFAYSYARIRRLVCLGGGFYCGAVADESVIGFDRPPNIKAR